MTEYLSQAEREALALVQTLGEEKLLYVVDPGSPKASFALVIAPQVDKDGKLYQAVKEVFDLLAEHGVVTLGAMPKVNTAKLNQELIEEDPAHHDDVKKLTGSESHEQHESMISHFIGQTLLIERVANENFRQELLAIGNT